MFMNTLIISIFVCIISTLFVLSVAYCMSRLRFKIRKTYMNIAMILGLFPGFMSMVAVYYILKIMGLSEGAMIRVALVLVYSGASGLGFYIAKGFFDTIPKSLDEAARVDGATRAQVLFKITLPMAKPIIIYTVLTAFMAPWGDFMFASYIAHNTGDGMNVAVGLQNLIGTNSSLAANYTHFCAGGVLVAIPVTILFMCLQKYYVEGVTGGAVKG